MLTGGQEVKEVLSSRQVVISTTEVVISSSKDRTQGSQLAQHLPPVGPGSSSGHALQAGLLSLGWGLLGFLLLGELVREVRRVPTPETARLN